MAFMLEILPTLTSVVNYPNASILRGQQESAAPARRPLDCWVALRWTGAGFLEAEKSFRRIQGHKDLWVLATALGRHAASIDPKMKTAYRQPAGAPSTAGALPPSSRSSPTFATTRD